jgi:hypothetical protein
VLECGDVEGAVSRGELRARVPEPVTAGVIEKGIGGLGWGWGRVLSMGASEAREQ